MKGLGRVVIGSPVGVSLGAAVFFTVDSLLRPKSSNAQLDEHAVNDPGDNSKAFVYAMDEMSSDKWRFQIKIVWEGVVKPHFQSGKLLIVGNYQLMEFSLVPL